MRTLFFTLLAAAALMLAVSASAEAASFKSCPDVNTKINGKNYKISTHTQAKGVTCAGAKTFLVSFATGNAIDPPNAALEALRKRCKADKNQKGVKVGRTAYTCASANGKRAIKGWIING